MHQSSVLSVSGRSGEIPNRGQRPSEVGADDNYLDTRYCSFPVE
jgi:hypothetical protein